MFHDRPALRKQIERFQLGPAIATLALGRTDAVWTESGGRGHLTIWLPADDLLEQVVQRDNG